MPYLWHLYWPVLLVALAIGIVTGALAFRLGRSRMRKASFLAIGSAAVLTAMALWHGPYGTAERYRSTIESDARATLVHYEMLEVQARLQRGPLARRLWLSGPADAFQRGELRRIMRGLPGLADVRWTNSQRKPGFLLPLLAEAELFALISFGLGLLVSYLVELRRRSRAEWRW